MLMKYLSEYQPCRMRSTSSLNTGAGSRRRSNTVMKAIMAGTCSTWPSGAFEVVDTVVDAGLYRRGRFLTTVARWLSLGFGLLSLAFVWDGPLTRRGAAVGIAAGYAAWMLATHVWHRRRPADRRVRIAHDLADAAAVGL